MLNSRDRRETSPAAWWQQDGALYRFMVDLLLAEAQFLRPGGPWPPMAAFQPDKMLGMGGLGFDSLECMAMAAALSQALFLHESGLDSALVVNTRLGDWHEAVRVALDRCSTRICFRSSGSTGPRRYAIHNLIDLDAEIAFFATKFIGCRRIIVNLPSHHIYGFLFSLILPAQLNVPVLDMRNRFPDVIAATLQPGDLAIGHPGFWAEVTRAAPSGWPADVVGMTSGAPCPDDVAEAARGAGLSRLLQIYGSSETGGIGWRDDHALPYRLLPSWRMTREGAFLKRDGRDEIETPDRLCWLDAERFFVKGRRDAVVQVGGLNVHLEQVRDVLCEHPAVAGAAVRLMAAHEGSRLKAFIVPSDLAAPHEALRRTLHAHTEARLSIAERPRAFSIGLRLPVTPAGKPADWPLPAA